MASDGNSIPRRPRIAALLIACVLLPWLALAGCGKRATHRDFALEADSLSAKSDSARMVALLKEWRRAKPDDPEACVAEANFWLELATESGVAVTTKPPSGEDISISDPKTGKVVGSISEADRYDSLSSRRATRTLELGIVRWPYRLDFYLGHAHVDELVDDFDSELKILGQAISYAKRHPGALRWTHGERLREAPDSFMAGAIHEYASNQLDKETPAGDSAFAALALLGVDAYPKDVRLLNDVAATCDMRGQQKEALAWLLKAEAADTSDALVLHNISKEYRTLGDIPRARQYLRLAMRRTPDPQDRAAEAEELKALK